MDRSAKVCMQFLWDMSIKSGMGAQDRNLWVLHKMENTFNYFLLCLVTRLFSSHSISDSLKGKMAQNQWKDLPK